jgi:hypothetical protein
VSQITANWEAFFNGKSSAAQKISLLENGQKFAVLINAQAGSGLASRGHLYRSVRAPG